VDEIDDQLRNLIVSHLPQALARSGVPMLDLAANYGQLGKQIAAPMAGEFAKLGLQLTTLLIENISLPREVEESLDKRASMGVLGNLQQYTQFQAANAIEAAAGNEGGGGAAAAAGMTAGLGLAVGGQMAQQLQAQSGAPGASAAAVPPPLPNATQWFVAVNGQQMGPLPESNLTGMVSAGQLTPTTLVWSQGMPGWVPARQALAAFFASQPPPLPPAGAGTDTDTGAGT
jgi:membrane protease subunit (stomatin/prohibitin family)